MDMSDRFRGCLLGLACGDALGTTVEFKQRGSFPKVTSMVGGGPFGLEPGQWTDDTSMALCLAESLVSCGGFDPADQMRRYVQWWKQGHLSSTGACFDIGVTTRTALARFQSTGDPFAGSTDPHSAGNGCIMRLAPVPMYFHGDWTKAVQYSGDSSRTTHGAVECVEASRLFGSMIFKALAGQSKEEILFGEHIPPGGKELTSPAIREIATGAYRAKTAEKIQGSGYVVRSLEAALWCFYRTHGYSEAVLTAVNLGDDADTTGAICGQIAGAFYGEASIPQCWRDETAMKDAIVGMANASGKD